MNHTIVVIDMKDPERDCLGCMYCDPNIPAGEVSCFKEPNNCELVAHYDELKAEVYRPAYAEILKEL